MTIVGALARIHIEDAGAVQARLASLGGVELFSVESPGRVGLIVEASDLDAAHARITREIEALDGVLAVWPVFVHAGPVLEEAGGGASGPGVRQAKENRDELFAT